MSTETNQETSVTSETNAGEGTQQDSPIQLSKAEYDALKASEASLGSLKREFKDLKKSIETKTTEAPQQNHTTADNSLLEKSYLRAAGVSHPEDVDLALQTAKKWNMAVDALVDDPDFQIKLEKQRTNRSNLDATSNLSGNGNTSSAKSDPAYWIAKGTPPSATDVPDRKTRATIARAMIASTKNSKKFWND